MCNPNLARKHPWNYALLFVITLGISFTTGITCAAFTPYSVFIAVCMLVVVVTGLMVFWRETRYVFLEAFYFKFGDADIVIMIGAGNCSKNRRIGE